MPARRMADMCVVKPRAAMAMASRAVSSSVMVDTVLAGSRPSELKATTPIKMKANQGMASLAALS